MAKEILIVDIKTTGYLNQGGKIIEIGIVKLDLETGNKEPIYDSLIKEDGFDISHTKEPFEWGFNNSNLSFQQVLQAPNLENQRELIQDLFYEYKATAYDKQFNFGFLKDRGFKINELACPMLILTPLINLKSNKENKSKGPTLKEAFEFLYKHMIYGDEYHSALHDSVHAASIVYELYRQGRMDIEFDKKNNLDTIKEQRKSRLHKELKPFLEQHIEKETALRYVKDLIDRHKEYFVFCYNNYFNKNAFRTNCNFRFKTIKNFIKNAYINDFGEDIQILNNFPSAKLYWIAEGKSLLHKYHKIIDWSLFSKNNEFPWDEALIKEYDHLIDFNSFSLISNFNWSIEFIAEYEDKLNFHLLSYNKALPWSLKLYDKYKHRWSYTSNIRSIGVIFPALDMNPNLPWNDISLKDFYGNYSDEISLLLLANKGINWTDELMNEFIPDLVFNKYWVQPISLRTRSEKEHWVINALGLFWNDKLIEDNKYEIDWRYLSSNENIIWSMDMLINYWNQWVWNFDVRIDDEIEDDFFYKGNYYKKKNWGLCRNEKIPWNLQLILLCENKINWESFKYNETAWEKCFSNYLDEGIIGIIKENQF
ncbi:MAG: hypothetical protein ACOC2U_02085 [bacterium]